MSLFTIKEAADVLRMCTQTLYRWVKRGVIPSVPWGSRGKRITSEVIDQLIKNGLDTKTEFKFDSIGKSCVKSRSRLNGGRAWR